MSQIDVLRPIEPVIFSGFDHETTTYNHSNDLQQPICNGASTVIDQFPSLKTLHINALDPDVVKAYLEDDETILRGSVDSHLRSRVAHIQGKAALVDDAERAFFVADLNAVYRQHQRWLSALPDIEPFYAVKCNPDPTILKLMARLGLGFDCASQGEMDAVLSLEGGGVVSPDRIVFANPCKATSFVRGAQRRGVRMMTFDNADELVKIARVYPEGSQLILRILTDDSASVCRLGIKFGAPMDTVEPLLERAKSLGLDVIGVSFHVGSGCQDPNAYVDACRRAREVFDVAARLGFPPFKLLDVGGGFDGGVGDRFERSAATLRAALEKYFPLRIKDGIRVIGEPGRFYVARAFTLAANVIARRDSAEPMYYINEGVYSAFNCILFDHQVVSPEMLTVGGRFVEESGFSGPCATTAATTSLCSIWGPTCDALDCVCAQAYLPRDVAVGDWMVFRDMGAYTVCAASRFNGFAKADVVYTWGPAVRIW